jgi:hypothetical protein
MSEKEFTYFKNFVEELNPWAILQQDGAQPYWVYPLDNLWTHFLPYGSEAVSQLHGLQDHGI